ncbi:site-specific integrase [Herbaspirillum aquaticum]|jgi:integrase|uniref:site-specific integrase n=1 Tax=Herbaspirillum aquaticum TaxID=568783 RepID=UPI0024DE8E55|nr:site-specific integrase [Herbaspirillum aquaticum]
MTSENPPADLTMPNGNPVNRTGSTALSELELQDRHRRFLSAATSDNTRRAYRSAIRHFQTWGGILPCDPALVIRYLLSYAQELNPRTLALRLTALSQWHQFQGFADPTANPDVRKTLKGIGRTHGKPKKKAKALPIEDLEAMVIALQEDASLQGMRNKALLQIAFFGAFRRSEVAALMLEELAWEPHGLVITLSRSKTDQDGQGIVKAIPYGEPGGICCPATALKAWLTASEITSGPVFRRVTRQGKIGPDPLYAGSINAILKACAAAADLPYVPELSGHSFRRGLATSAHRAGADFKNIKRQGGWRHDGTVQGYIDEANQFEENAAGSLLRRKP